MAAGLSSAFRAESLPRSRRIRGRLSSISTSAESFLSVVIVNFCQWRNTARLTKQLLQSHAARAADAELMILDNHSPKHPLLAKFRRAKGVSVRRFRRNLGFARAVNEGGRLANGEWILLLNPDTSVAPGFLDDVEVLGRKLMRDDPRAGVIGLGVLNSDGTPQPSCGSLPTLARTIARIFLPRSRRKCEALPSENRTSVPWATGCALLIRRDCLRELGGFDEDFFLYYEDVDFCRRASERGWKVIFEPSLRVTHHTPLHTRQVPASLRLMTRHALLTYGMKHWARWQAVLLGGLVWMESSLRQLGSWWAGDSDEMRIHGQIRKLVGDVLAGRIDRARSRIRQAAEFLEGASAAQDGRTC